MKRAATLAAIVLGFSRAAATLAHTDGGASEEPTWTFDIWLSLPLALSLLSYSAGLLKLRLARAHATRLAIKPVLTYAIGWLTLAAALLTPFHWLAEQLFTCHMLEHEILMTVAAPLLVAARPLGVFLWALPTRMRLQLRRAARFGPWASGWDWVTRPVNATVLHGAAIWIWHVPTLFDAAVADGTLHRLQHASFFVTALLFWHALARPSRAGEAVWHLFFTMLHTSLLGALIAVAPRVLYAAQTTHSIEWGLTPLEDQQLAGLLMWVPAGIVYASATLIFAARWIRGAGRELADFSQH